MKPTVLSDIEYLIQQKQQKALFLEQNGKNSSSVQYEIQILQGFLSSFENLFSDFFRLQFANQRIEKDYKWNKKGYKIVSGLIAARKWAVLTHQPFAYILQEIEAQPERSIERYRDLQNWYREGDRELRQFEQWYSPFVGDNAKTYKELCELNGFDYEKRLKVWKAKTVKRLQDLENPKNRVLKASITINEQNL